MGYGQKPVIVIGGGISGLSAAKLLVERSVDVVVLEAQDRVGGRTFTWRDPSTYGWVDMGGSWVGPTQNHILRLSKQLGLKTWVCYDDNDYMHYSKGKRCRHTTQWPGLWWRNPLAGFDLRYVAELMDRMCNEIPPDRPWTAPKAKEWDRMTVQEFFDRTCWTKDAAEYLKANCVTSITSAPDQLSLLWFLWYVRSSNGMWRIWNATNGAQERKFVGGSSTVSEKLYCLLGDRVKLGQVVSHIQQNDNGVIVTTRDGATYEGSHLIMTVTLPMQLRMTYDPPLPPLRRQLLQRVSMGMAIKAQMWFKNAFWIEQGLNGFFTCADGEEIVGNTSVDIRDDCPYPAITAFVFSEKAAMAIEMPPEQRKEAIVESVTRILQAPKGEKPVWYTEENFMENPYIGGCYTATYPPGVMTTCGHVIRQPFKRIHFGGTETAAEWTGYMNGAVEAGERCAREVLGSLDKIPPQDVHVKEPSNDIIPVRDFDKSLLERHPPSVGSILTGLGLTTSAAALTAIYLFKFAKQ